MKHNYEQRKQNRIDNAKKQAAKNRKLSDSAYNQAHDMASIIPMGQPILVGHHSEKRDRRYRQRIDDKMRKAVEADKKAEYYERKAEAIENNTSISSDDPTALEQLRQKLAELEQKQSFMKEANRCIRKKDKEAFLHLPDATEELWQELNNPDRVRGIGYPYYGLTNNGAKIRSVKQRIRQMELLEQRPAQEVKFEGGVLRENKEAGRIQFKFDAKPDEKIRIILKRARFIYSPTENAHQRKLNANGIRAAKYALADLKKMWAEEK
ncbi:DUF3560 domain-containing protein [Niabella sp. CC-SYL272]|uniref:DUF3560 domain-containing protein n=1 Tax=Niabella agricola TaxID=2891571 RepID=UPI001F2D7E3C|nr:DUF3560 domain-containing protein [Niabella agricola]MCF3109584.1 DUF3560 domain-containing protein [Niabella agricola]